MTLETLITFLTIENNNINNYIVTFEYRVMATAFAILAMFNIKCIKKKEELFILYSFSLLVGLEWFRMSY